MINVFHDYIAELADVIEDAHAVGNFWHFAKESVRFAHSQV